MTDNSTTVRQWSELDQRRVDALCELAVANGAPVDNLEAWMLANGYIEVVDDFYVIRNSMLPPELRGPDWRH